MKKITSIMLVFVMLLSMVNIIALATDDTADSDIKYPTGGLIVDTWESLITSDSESYFQASAITRVGDVNRDGYVTSLDVRQCLRIAAGMEKFDHIAELSADVNYDGDATSRDARIILQMVAGMKAVDTIAETRIGDTAFDGLVVGPLESSGSTGYIWHCEYDENALSLTEATFLTNDDPEIIGSPVNHYFAFKPNKAGTYTINFKLITPGREVVDQFNCILTVKDNA